MARVIDNSDANRRAELPSPSPAAASAARRIIAAFIATGAPCLARTNSLLCYRRVLA